jgi:hypothetical protein
MPFPRSDFDFCDRALVCEDDSICLHQSLKPTIASAKCCSAKLGISVDEAAKDLSAKNSLRISLQARAIRLLNRLARFVTSVILDTKYDDLRFGFLSLLHNSLKIALL